MNGRIKVAFRVSVVVDQNKVRRNRYHIVEDMTTLGDHTVSAYSTWNQLQHIQDQLLTRQPMNERDLLATCLQLN